MYVSQKEVGMRLRMCDMLTQTAGSNALVSKL